MKALGPTVAALAMAGVASGATFFNPTPITIPSSANGTPSSVTDVSGPESAPSVAVDLGLRRVTRIPLSNVWAVNLRANPNTLLTFPVGAPMPMIVASVGIDTYAMDFNSAGTALYAVSVSGATVGSLGTIDLVSGAFNAIAPVTGVPSTENATGMSVDPLTETFYLSTYGTTNNLYMLNPATGATTFVGNMGTTGNLFIDIAISPWGQMYAHDIATDALFLIDKFTGAASVIGPTGHLANFAQGMDFDYADGNLYATIYTGGGTGKFVSFDLNTGAGLVLTDTTPWNAEMEMAIDSPIWGPTVGACCYPDGSCAVTAEADCAGVWHPEWADCGIAECPQPPIGACCSLTGTCTMTTQADCAGTWAGAGSSCFAGENPCWNRGDLNCDGVINSLDISPFVKAMTNEPAYYQANPLCNHLNADIDCNGVVNSLDISPFVRCITATCPPCP